ncbi:hypothetical protein PHLCEN_2v7009 [Hermanssonia centrifuga]|uniref:4-coumarate--CoA ligase n=1 Tax=Hermanssonia centrifuga TaxID=98765 RepID=A0A2R6NXR4_9APHY|nr:hypothetical protein PHLCEN_2v7009 [Hermanssonia centrifuga]
MTVYQSHFPPVPVPNESIFTNLCRTRFNDFPPERPAFIDAASGTTITRRELRDLSLSMAWGLRNELPRLGGIPLKRGDVAMVFSPNTIAWPIMLFGSIAAGLRMTLANSAYTAREILHQWKDSGAKVAFVHPSLLAVTLETFALLDLSLTEAKRRIIVVDWHVPSQAVFKEYICMSDLLGKGSLAEEEKFSGEQANETTLLCYSSGTTGKPKGVETTHRNLVAVLAMVDIAYPDIREPNPTMIGVLPFYHIYGVVKLLHFPWTRGMPVVIMQRFDPVDFCRYIEKYKVTQALVVPPMCLVLSRHPAVEKFNLSSLRVMLSGAAPLGGPLMNALRNRLLKLGTEVFITQGYGLTETSPTTHVLPAEDSIRKVGSIGNLLPNLEARLVIEDTDEAKEGEPGELWVRGPTIMKGYLGNVEATTNSITEDGWFKTGDIAVRDTEGHYAIVDRRKELIKYKHPEIVDAAVIGINSEKEATELPRAYVVHAKGLATGERIEFGKQVQEWIKAHVARHKFLRGGVVVIDVIPKSAAGKILRKDLRERAKTEVLLENTPRAKL